MSSAHAEIRLERRQWASRALLPIAGVVAAGAFAGTASAQDGPPAPSSSAVSQYAELVPTGKGPTAPGLQQARASSLSPGARAALDGIRPTTAKALATIATSSNYGAPATKLVKAGVTPGGSSSAGGTSLKRTFDAAATAASPISDTDLMGLLLTLLVITGGGAALAVQARAPR